ncbi:nuclear formin-like protein, putative [Plasmodium gallinaceum]|uniref:Nuclear formin-like protein, putative n=1 Tax=Plasmodium gallinaceum TaxID=5849 RepID=A0A1J1GSZ0_PLAGA|nr:nuclear formin-like protein, putative [Plasmodium gallinaceum]CRG95558.1 nuclear formin-like protein, putative [Plasmodium gallinaceum]
MAINTLLENENKRFKKINEKLLYLLNKYRYAYLKSLELINFYEIIIKKNFYDNKDKDLFDTYKKKRQCEYIFEEEILLRKKFKNNLINNKISIDIIPYKNTTNILKEKDVANKNEINIEDKKKDDKCIASFLNDGINEKNKSDYINLGALDFSAYKEDSEGCIKYFEKEKNKINSDRINREDINNSLKSVYNYELKRKPLYNQSTYLKHSNIKNSHITTLSSMNKSIYIDKYSKINNNKKVNMINKSVYQNTLNQKILKSDLNRSIFVSNSRHPSKLNKNICTDSKNLYNKNININEKSSSTVKNTLINKNKNSEYVVNKKMNINKSNNLQNSIYMRKLNTTNISNHSFYVNKNPITKSIYRSNTNINNKKKEYKENLTENKDGSINMKYRIGENNNKNSNEDISLDNIGLNDKNKKEIKNISTGEQTNIEINKGRYCEFSTKNSGGIYSHIPLELKNIEDLIENDHMNKNSETEVNSCNIVALKNIEDLHKSMSTNEEKSKKADCYLKEEHPSNEKKNNSLDICFHVEKEKIAVDNLHNELQNEENVNEEKTCEVLNYQSNCSIYNLNNKEKYLTCEDKTQTNRLEHINIKKELLEYNDNKNRKNLIKFSVDRNEDENNYLLNNDNDSKESFEDTKKADIRSKPKHYCQKEESNHTSNNEREKESHKIPNSFNILENNNSHNSIINTENITSNNDVMNNNNLILKNEKGTNFNIEKEDSKDKVNVINENATNTETNIDKNDQIDNIKKFNNKMPVNFKNIILNINEEIKNKLHNSDENDNLLIKNINNKQPISKGHPFPSSLRKNLLLPFDKEVKVINNNRANLHIEMNFNFEYITLDTIDLDKAMNEGIHNYKKIEESYIESGEHIKDIFIYNDLMEKEKKTLSFCNLDDKEGMNEKNQVLFKSSNQIKSEITKSIGISIFQYINTSIHPSKSLVSDEKLEIWFTKKKREKNDKKNLMESNSSQLLLFKNNKRRISTMGFFCQPLIIMLSSLKRQSAYNSLKKIITSLILCTCDSASLEKILHTLPEESSKNYTLWKETINKLYIHVGGMKNEIIKKFLEVKKEDSDGNNDDYDDDDDNDDTCVLNEKNKYENLNLKTYDFMKGINHYDNCLNNSFSSTNTTSTYSKKKYMVEDSNIYEDEEFCLFICTISNVHRRLRYLLLVDNFDFIYEDLLKHIKNKLNSIELIVNKHVLLKQLFCNILYLCNWLNEPKIYKWFQWNSVVKKLEKLYGYSDNGKISRDRCIMLLLAEHTGEIFTEKELNNLKKVSKFHIKDLYDKSIDFINSYLELKNQMNTEEFKKNCCIRIDEESIFSEDKFLEKIKLFVEKNYKKMLFIIWNIVLLIKQYLVLIIWLGDIKPFYPLFSHIDENRKIKYSNDLFINIALFFESYNKYIHVIKKKNEIKVNRKSALLKNTDDCFLSSDFFSSKVEKPVLNIKNNLNNNFYSYMDDNITDDNSKKKYYEDKEKNNSLKPINNETKKRKSLTNTVDYACKIKRKSLEHEKKKFIKKESLENICEVEFELSD